MRHAQDDLFGTPLLPGLSAAPDFLTPEEEDALIARIEALARRTSSEDQGPPNLGFFLANGPVPCQRQRPS